MKHSSIKACPVSTLATKVAENGDKLSPETATKLMLPNVAENGNKSRCFRQHLLLKTAILLPETATFCLRFRQQLWQGAAEYLAVT